MAVIRGYRLNRHTDTQTVTDICQTHTNRQSHCTSVLLWVCYDRHKQKQTDTTSNTRAPEREKGERERGVVFMNMYIAICMYVCSSLSRSRSRSLSLSLSVSRSESRQSRRQTRQSYYSDVVLFICSLSYFDPLSWCPEVETGRLP